ncbi:MAG: hypothetical protein ABI977_21740 [Acidobacteriota bacterium]
MKTNTHPPGSITGHSNAKCYANADRNCSTKISKEHYISETLLRQIQLNNTARVAGLKWQQKERFKEVPLSGLASFILCERHNNALSPLDSCMGSFSEVIRDYDRSLLTETSAQTSEQRNFSGDDIGRWMLKCLFGLAISGNLTTTNLKPECTDLLYANIDWPEGWGLYFSAPLTSSLYHSDSFLIETLVDPARQLILAANFVIRGVPLVLCLGKPDKPESFGMFRPEAVILSSGECEKVLLLSWGNGPQSQAILLERSGAYDGPPPDWNEWEQTG